jgi:hypothetical protein
LAVVLWVTTWGRWAIALAILLYPAYKIWAAAGQSNGTHQLFTKEGIELVRPAGSSLVPWASLSRVIETRKGFLFYQGARIAAFVPRRCLQGDAETTIIRKFAAKYVPSAILLA